ncbi:MAG: immune inhibitor A, partial [Proteobacteria bacterium]|nr:immune inhibitor A [Pseudomonadota bacterium]
LDLTVQQAANTYLANNFTANNSSTTGSADTLNTVEQVRFSAPVTGTYNITVDATNIPGNGTFGSDKQGFALIVSGYLSSGGAIPSSPTGPSALTAVSNGLAGVDLGWSDVSTDYDSYEIYRIQGSCATADLTKLKYIGASSINAFTDASTIGGHQYSYKIRAFSADLISEYTNCIDIVSDQLCDLPPVFNQNSIAVTSNLNAACQISLNWQGAISSCPSATNVQYNVYRSLNHNFIPDVSNLIATTGLNSTSFNDIAVMSGQPYSYIVKAEDTTTSGSGPNNGNESLETREVATTALGVATAEGNLVDDVDNLTVMGLGSIWSISAEQASNGSLSYRSAIEGSNTYPSNICARMHSIAFSIPASPTSPPNITYQSRFNIEPDWDGVVVEISNDGGANWSDLPPNGGYPNDFSSTGNPPINICGYPASQGAFNGNTGGAFVPVAHDLTAYQGQTVQIRWSLSTDPGSEEEGFYLDELAYNNIDAPQACLSGEFIFVNGFEE